MNDKQLAAAKVLIVEDESIIAMDIKRGLKQLGYTVTDIASRSEEAFQSIQENYPDLILMDIQLKGKHDGIETAQQIHLEYDIPIIFLTAYADEHTLQRAKLAEPLGYVLKPFVEADLHTAIEVALHKQYVVTEQLSISKKALVKSEQEFKLFVESVKDYALFMLDTEGYIISWNKGAERIKGYRQEEVIGKHFSIFYPEEDIQNKKPTRELEIAMQEGRYEEEGWRIRKDGTSFWANVTINSILDEKNNLYGFAKITRDITERKHMLDELQAAIQMRDDFLSIASHELKTPVTTMLLQLQGLSRRLQKGNNNSNMLSAEDILKNVSICEKQAKKLANFLDELLDLTRIRLGIINLELQEINLGQFAQDVVSHMASIFPQKLVISVEIKKMIKGKWDSNRLEQVITNLISNAIKYGNDKPITIIIDEDIDKQQAKLIVHDYGIGIPQEMQSKIFERFERAASTRNLGGLGLGLYITRQIIEAHRGSIQVQSELGEGSTFTVLLPLS